MENLMKKIHSVLSAEAIVISSKKGSLLFIECPKTFGTLLDIAEDLEEKGYKMVQGIQHTAVPGRIGHMDLYSITLRKD